jgi:hypothetical protein
LLPGESIPNKKLSYESSQFGTLSQKSIVETLKQVFGAKESQNRREKRRLVFDQVKLSRLGGMYDVSVKIKVGPPSTDVTDVMDVTHVGLDRHIYEQAGEVENENNSNESSNIIVIEGKNNEKSMSGNTNEDPLPLAHPSQASHPSQYTDISTTNIMSANNNSIYRISEHSDTFACQNCRFRGDRFFMEVHKCSISK